MRNGIALRIEEKYGDLRKSEKIAADYILEHLNRLAELPLDRLAEYSGEMCIRDSLARNQRS